MKYIWTVQNKRILEIIEKNKVYYPSFENENRKLQESYQIVLDGFNKVNRCNYKGLVFCFSKSGHNETFNDINELYDFFINKPAITCAFNFWNDSHIIMQLAYYDDFNLIPVDFNDFTDLMSPPYYPEVYKSTCNDILNGTYRGAKILKSFTQVHIPYIKKENIINIYGNFDKVKSDDIGKVVTYKL